MFRFVIINLLLFFPFFYKKYQIGKFEFIRRFFIPYYEIEYKNLVQFLEFELREVNVVIDIGANVGQSSYAFRRIFQDAEIHAFEPNPSIFEVLKENLHGSRVFVYNFGLGSISETINIYIPMYKDILFTGLGTCNLAHTEKYLNKRNIFNFKTSRFSVVSQKINIEVGDSFNFQPDLVKIDVEGFEVDVLKGLLKTVKNSKPIFLIECADSHSEVKAFFSNFNYKNLEYSRKSKSWLPSSGENLMQVFIPSN